MAIKRARQRTITEDRVTIRIYPFGGDKPIIGWIEDGYLSCVCGAVAAGARVEIDRPQGSIQQEIDYLDALSWIMAKRYLNCVIVLPNGTREDAHAV